jgi:ketosteroid isomerase-like protein
MRIFVLISGLAALTPAANVFAAGHDAAQAIAALEADYSQSFVSGDTRIAARLVADDFVGIEPNGKTADKAGVLADVTSEKRPVSLKITALTVRVHGDTALALGTEEDRMNGAPAIVHRRWLDTWRQTPDGWRLVGSAEFLVKP